MEDLKEIKQLKRKEEILEHVSYYRMERLKRSASPYMLALAGVAGLVAIGLLISMFTGRSRS